MWTVVASPIIFATNPLNFTDIMKEVLLNMDMLSIHQDAAGIAGDRRGFASNPGCAKTQCQLWSRTVGSGEVQDQSECTHINRLSRHFHLPKLPPLLTLASTRTHSSLSFAVAVIVLYNTGATAQEITFDFSLLPPGWAGVTADALDLWTHQSVSPPPSGSYTATVPSHGVAALRLTAQ